MHCDRAHARHDSSGAQLYHNSGHPRRMTLIHTHPHVSSTRPTATLYRCISHPDSSAFIHPPTHSRPSTLSSTHISHSNRCFLHHRPPPGRLTTRWCQIGCAKKTPLRTVTVSLLRISFTLALVIVW